MKPFTTLGNFLKSSLFVLLFFSAEVMGANIAPSGEATQSHTNHNGDAELAIDGNTDGNYTKSSVTYTQQNTNYTWWHLDLGSVQMIDAITLHNRTDANKGERLAKVRVMLSDTKFSQKATKESLNASKNLADWKGQVGKTPDVIEKFDAINTAGRYILIQQTMEEALSLAEVEVEVTRNALSCPGDDVLNINGATTNATHTYQLAENIGRDKNYYHKFKTAVDGNIAISTISTNGRRYKMDIATTCAENYIHDGNESKKDSSTFAVKANTTYYIEVRTVKNQHLKVDLKFDFTTSTPTTTPPVMKSIPDQIIGSGSSLNLHLSNFVEQTNGDPITGYTVGCSDTGMTFDRTTGVFSGRPVNVKILNCSATAADKDGTSNRSTFKVKFTDANSSSSDTVTTSDYSICGIFNSSLNTWKDIGISTNSNFFTRFGSTAFAVEVNGTSSVYANTLSTAEKPLCKTDKANDVCLQEKILESVPTLPVFVVSSKTDTPEGNNRYEKSNYDTIDIASSMNVTFDPKTPYEDDSTRNTVNIAKLSIKDGATVVLKAGDYWIGSLDIGNGVAITTEGEVKIYVKNSTEFKGEHIAINANGSSANLYMMFYGNLTVTRGNLNLHGYIYVAGEFSGNHTTGDKNFLTGAISSADNINLSAGWVFNYDDSGLQDEKWGDCGCVKVNFKARGYAVEEDLEQEVGEKFFNVEIILSRVVPYDVTVLYSTEDGTATVVDGDYRQRLGQIITIKAGETSVTVPLSIYNDPKIELSQTFFLQLSAQQPNDKVCLGDVNRTIITITEQEDSPVCFEDNFENGYDDGDGGWRVLGSAGYTPKIETILGNKRLRLSNGTNRTSAYITRDYEFETSENLIIVEFDYYAYGGCYSTGDGLNGNGGGIDAYYGADGIVSILFDSAVGASPSRGALGGSMGYAQNLNGPGFEGGWLGLGIDEYGNFGNNNEKRNGTFPSGKSLNANSVVIRGDGSGTNGYEFLQGVRLKDDPIARKRASAGDFYSGRYKMVIDARDPAHLYIRLDRSKDKGTTYKTIITTFDAKDTKYNQKTTPEKIRYAISAGTGTGCNNHELEWIRVRGNCGQFGNPTTTGTLDAWDTFRDDQTKPPSDKNISTKIVGKPFSVSLGSFDSTNTRYEKKTGTGTIDVAVFKNSSVPEPISDPIQFDVTNTDHIPVSAELTVDVATSDARIGFWICATNEPKDENGDVDFSKNLYRIYPSSSCGVKKKIYDCFAKTKDQVPTWHICYSSDNFAVRPERFEISGMNADLEAGKGYPVDYKAIDAKNKNALFYHEASGGSFELASELRTENAKCENQSIDIQENIQFVNGWHKGKEEDNKTLTFLNTVGDFNLTIQEVNGSEYAKVDADDTPYLGSDNKQFGENIFIEPHTIDVNLTLKNFRIDADFTNAHKGGTNPFTYLHDISGSITEALMASEVNATITAIISGSDVAENYTKECYAENSTFTLNYSLEDISLPSNSLSDIQWSSIKEEQSGVPDNLSSALATSDSIDIALGKEQFRDDAKGLAKIEVKLNFDRKRDKEINPFKLKIGEVSIKDANDANGSLVIDKKANYLYARAKASQDYYDAGTKNNIDTPILALIYCDTAGQDCSQYATTAIPFWFRSIEHSMANSDGSIVLTSPPTVVDGAGNPSVTTTVSIETNGRDGNVNVSSGVTTELPMTVDIMLEEANTDMWMIYNKTSHSAMPNPFYRVIFRGQSGWSGVGKTGDVIETEINKRKTDRMSW